MLLTQEKPYELEVKVHFTEGTKKNGVDGLIIAVSETCDSG